MARTKKAKGMRPTTAFKREIKQEIKNDEKALVKSINKVMHSQRQQKNHKMHPNKNDPTSQQV